MTHLVESRVLPTSGSDPVYEISDLAPVMIWISGIDQTLTFLNKSWLDFTGQDRSEAVETQWYGSLHAEDLEPWLRVYGDSSARGAGFTMVIRIQRKDGQYRWMSCSGQPRFGSDGQWLGYIGTCIDIHDQKMNEEALEKKVSDRTVALLEANSILQQRNHELEQFAYVTSHDLQEPLRKIRIFVDMLQRQEVSPGSGVDRTDSLNRIRSSADRMAQLIKDLLDYSRLGVSGNPFTPTDLNTIVLAALRDFDLLIEETKARVHVMPLPIIEAIPLQMNQLFSNLVGNALKFQHPGRAPVLRIYAEDMSAEEAAHYPNLDTDQDYCRIIVEDNGIGFNQAFVEKIFVIFQRLHPKGHFPGTGIGLAICRKIVQNHRGELLAFGKENEGAAFHIILPRTAEAFIAGAGAFV
jgi:two-component system, chemotaxis family, CheB/CheR fusion protein